MVEPCEWSCDLLDFSYCYLIRDAVTMDKGFRVLGTGSKTHSGLITSRRVIFTPSVDIKNELKQTSISITCIDRDGNIVKRVTSTDDAEVEDPENENPDDGGNTPSGGNPSAGSGTDQNQGGQQSGGGTPSGDDDDAPVFG